MDSPTVAGSEPLWYLEISGERTGPYPWPFILELARDRRLQAHHFLWRPGLPTASRADAFSELEPLFAAKAIQSPRLLALCASIVWIFFADAYVAFTVKDWPTLIDGILIAKVDVFGAFVLILLSQVGKVVYDSQVPYTCEAAESIDA